MKQEFYTSVFFGLGLTLVAGLFQSWLHFQAGINMYTLPSFQNWFLAMSFISLITSALLLTYYHHKNYHAAFWTGLIAGLTTFVSLFYLFLPTLYPIFRKHPDVFVFIGVSINLIYAVSLLVSGSGIRPWLKRAGIVSLMLCLAHLMALGWFMYVPAYPVNAAIDSVRQWLLLAERIVPVLFILNFLGEYPNAVKDQADTASFNRFHTAKVMLVLAGMYSLFLSLYLASENYDLSHISPKQNALAQPFEKGSYISSRGDTLLYRLLKPVNYDPGKRYPLVVALPYSCWPDNTRQIDACPMAKWLSTDENKKKYPAFVFVPRCPPQTGWGGVANTPSVAGLAIEAIVALNKTYSIDYQRRYISGVSRGGYGSWHMVGMQPQLFAAAIPVCGEGNPDQAKNMVAVSIWAFHGAKDVNVPVSGSRDIITAIKKAGGSPRYTEYPNAGHGIWENVIKTPGLLDWLFAQKQLDSAKSTKI
ncbi:peptidase [Dyadobacter chenwenxiniae]|uniref:Peptidase n=1 Tax=Dyadobacter chenwenxiniae TaxID=2906456 RepID=A0A9X1PLX5_9BACT|nr:peptidase [Dyadobacter chenwenxiniae]MCF0063737.1 peptidase [Dyadobacter chenwenxiniae]UON83412.1 peptidase [Dyadobacter chenwenxiniae]